MDLKSLKILHRLAVKTTLTIRWSEDSDNHWNTTLRNGFLKDSQYSVIEQSLNVSSAKALSGVITDTLKDAIEIVFHH